MCFSGFAVLGGFLGSFDVFGFLDFDEIWWFLSLVIVCLSCELSLSGCCCSMGLGCF